MGYLCAKMISFIPYSYEIHVTLYKLSIYMIYHVNIQLYQRMLIIAAWQAVEFWDKWTKRLYRQVKIIENFESFELISIKSWWLLAGGVCFRFLACPGFPRMLLFCWVLNWFSRGAHDLKIEKSKNNYFRRLTSLASSSTIDSDRVWITGHLFCLSDLVGPCINIHFGKNSNMK